MIAPRHQDQIAPAMTSPLRPPSPIALAFAGDAPIELLSQMVEEISGELAIEPLLARIVERACRLLGADDGQIGLYDAHRDDLQIAATFGRKAGDSLPRVPRGLGLAGYVLACGRPVVCRYGDLPQPLSTESPDKQVLGMPIRCRGELIGIFGLGTWTPGLLGEDALTLLGHFSRHAAVAIDNARRYAAEKRRAERFALIARVAGIIASAPELDVLLQRAADAIHEVLDYPNVDIPLLDPTNPHVLVVRIRGGDYKRLIQNEDRLSIATGIMGAAVRERRSQLVNDVPNDPRYVTPPDVLTPLAELATPIMHGDDVLGVLNVEGDRPFDELDRVSLEIIAEHLAVAIQNARLFQQAGRLAIIEERHRLARELHDNVTQILSSISLLSQSLVEAWKKAPDDGERRVRRLGELSQMGFAEMRALLRELTLDEPGDPVASCPVAQALATEDLLGQQGLAMALRRIVAVMTPGDLHVLLHFDRYLAQPLASEQAMLRICQEGLSNVVRHARAHRVDIRASVDGDRVCLRIADDGEGIARGVRTGRGHASMLERIAELGGELRVSTRAPHGTVIEALLPRRDCP